jgi:hypothetical protein
MSPGYESSSSSLRRMDSRNWRIFMAKITLLVLSSAWLLSAVFTVILGQASFTHLWPHVWMKYEDGVVARFDWARYAFLSYAFAALTAIVCTCTATLASLIPLIVYAAALHLVLAFSHFWIEIEGIELDAVLNWAFVVMHLSMSAAAAWLWLLLLRSNHLKLQRILAIKNQSTAICLPSPRSSRKRSRSRPIATNRKTNDKANLHEIELPTFDIEESLHRSQLEHMIRNKDKSQI